MYGRNLKKNNKAVSIKDAMERITTKMHTFHKLIQSDNGSEFKAAFREWTVEHNTKQY